MQHHITADVGADKNFNAHSFCDPLADVAEHVQKWDSARRRTISHSDVTSSSSRPNSKQISCRQLRNRPSFETKSFEVVKRGQINDDGFQPLVVLRLYQKIRAFLKSEFAQAKRGLAWKESGFKLLSLSATSLRTTAVQASPGTSRTLKIRRALFTLWMCMYILSSLNELQNL